MYVRLKGVPQKPLTNRCIDLITKVLLTQDERPIQALALVELESSFRGVKSARIELVV